MHFSGGRNFKNVWNTYVPGQNKPKHMNSVGIGVPTYMCKIVQNRFRKEEI